MQISNIKTINELSQLAGRVYIYLPTDELGKQFMQQAESEGFTFTDGVKPTKRFATKVMAVNSDRTINYVGTIGHMAFGSGVKTVGRNQLIRMTYLGNHIIPYSRFI